MKTKTHSTIFYFCRMLSLLRSLLVLFVLFHKSLLADELHSVDFVVESFDNEGALDSLDVEFREGTIKPRIAKHDGFGKGSLELSCEAVGDVIVIESIQNQTDVLYNARDAVSVSFWYKVVAMETVVQPEQFFQFTFSILDTTTPCTSFSCLEDNTRQLETWEYTGEQVMRFVDEWQQANFTFDADLWQRTDGTNDGLLDLSSIKGFNIMIDTMEGNFSGTIHIDHVAYHGNGDLVGAALKLDSWEEATASSLLTRTIFDSNVSATNTTQQLTGNGSLAVDYLIEQRAVWGGFISVEVKLPDRAYYNLSRSDEISFDYLISEGASESQRLHLRFIVVDMSDCDMNCDDWLNLEHYYTFHYVLDEKAPRTTKRMWLVGDTSLESSFSLTGWVGKNGNGHLDTSWISGFKFEININSQGDIGSFSRGAVELSDINVSKNISARETGIYLPFVEEPEVSFLAEELGGFRRVEFTNVFDCKQLCLASPDCNFALSTRYGLDCFMAEKLMEGSIVLKTTSYLRESTVTFWKDTPEARGDYCYLCKCIEEEELVDCRGSGLILPPKTFTPTGSWSPRILDLRDNPDLQMLGQSSLDAFDSLEELRLSRTLVFLDPSSLGRQTGLSAVLFENKTSPTDNPLLNAIRDNTESYGSKCCSRGRTNDQNLTWCDMKVYSPGIDSVYENFTQYLGVHSNVIVPASSFLSEAAESPEKCAEICNILEDCNFFSYDNRSHNANAVCWHFTSVDTTSYDCCRPESYSDIGQTTAGWISGRVTSTRRILDEAKVIVEPIGGIVLDESNEFEAQLFVRLGSTPTRGAVWVTLEAPKSLGYNISFTPPRVILYDTESSGSVTVKASISNRQQQLREASQIQTFSVSSRIEACDAAFHSTSLMDDPIISVRFSSREPWLIGTILAACISLLGIVSVYILLVQKNIRRQNAYWLIKLSDLEFTDPPVVLGRGTFGIVTKALYRGTTVAVKRALPSSCKRGGRLSYQRGLRYSREELHPESSMNLFDCSMLCLPEWSHTPNTNRKGIETTGSQDGLPCGSVERTREEYWELRLRAVSKSDGYLKTSFIKEMKNLSTLRHPCITTIMGAVIENRVDETLLVIGTVVAFSCSMNSHICFRIHGPWLPS